MSQRLVFWNPGSGKANLIDQLMSQMNDVQTRFIALDSQTDVHRELTTALLGKGDSVIAAGGDGTVNAVANVLMKLEPAQRPRLGVIPLGTANDFAGTLGLPDDPLEAATWLTSAEVVPLDVVRLQRDDFATHYVNVAAGGNSVRVSEELTDELKASWGAYCYIRGAIGVLRDMETFHVIADCDDERIELDAWAVIVANGRTNAGRIAVAPNASPSDGLLDVVLIRDGTVLDMVEIVSRSLFSSYLQCDQVVFRQVKRVRLESIPGMRFAVDGEVISHEPVQFDVVPGALHTYVGPEYFTKLQEAESVPACAEDGKPR